MNIRRGLFRLWVVVAAAWLIGTAAVSYHDLANPYFAPRAFYFPKNIMPATAKAELDKRQNPQLDWGYWEIKTQEGFRYTIQGAGSSDASKRLFDFLPAAIYELKPVKVDAYTPEFQDLEEGKTNGITNEITLTDLPGVSLFVRRDTPAVERDRQIDETHSIASNLRRTVVSERRWQTIRSMMLFGLIPPVLLFFAGVVLFWIARGFVR